MRLDEECRRLRLGAKRVWPTPAACVKRVHLANAGTKATCAIPRSTTISPTIEPSVRETTHEPCNWGLIENDAARSHSSIPGVAVRRFAGIGKPDSGDSA